LAVNQSINQDARLVTQGIDVSEVRGLLADFQAANE